MKNDVSADEADALWITWEDHRRSRELADAFHACYLPLTSDQKYLLRSTILTWRTIDILLRRRPRLLFVQNPSLILTTLVSLLRPLLGYRLVVDRHSNFELRTMTPPAPVRFIFNHLSRYTNNHADLTIVTNETLKHLSDSWGGRGFVLQDRLPKMDGQRSPLSPVGKHFVFVCTFSEDEPVAEVLAAARVLPADYFVAITGNAGKASPDLLKSAPPNVRFTGFLPEKDYQDLLASCDGVLGLTTRPLTLLCCAYEAVSLGRPMVLSDHKDLREYFRMGIVPTDNTAASLADAMLHLAAHQEELSLEVGELADILNAEWLLRFRMLEAEIQALTTDHRSSG